jgi:hypothetical protein
MFRIYCAFSEGLNGDSWAAGYQGHIVKIGHTGAKGEVKRIPSLNRGWRRNGEASAPLAHKEDWGVFGLWEVHRDSRETVKKIEAEIRDSFIDICGEFEMFTALKASMQEVHRSLNGLTEIVRIDLSLINKMTVFPPARTYIYKETRGLVGCVADVVRSRNAEWLEKTKGRVQAV